MSWELELATQRMEEHLRWAANERLVREARRVRPTRRRRRGLRIEIHVSWDVPPDPAPPPRPIDDRDDLVA